MTTTASPTISTTATRPVWKGAALSGVVAAAATVLVAAVASAAGISLDVDGEPIPLAGFATLTMAAVVVGYVLAIALNRWASRPRRTFTIITVVLTAASLVPDVTVAMDRGTTVVLIAAHLVAAAIVIPAIAARLDATR